MFENPLGAFLATHLLDPLERLRRRLTSPQGQTETSSFQRPTSALREGSEVGSESYSRSLSASRSKSPLSVSRSASLSGPTRISSATMM